MSSQSASGALARRAPTHVALEVTGNVVRAGSATRRFREGDARSLLTAYLSLIRGVRDQRRARSIELRSADIESLARYLGRPGSEVVEQLAEMMGATRSQRATMVTLFGAGALVIGLAGSTGVGRAQPAPSSRIEPGVALEAVAPEATPVQPPTTIAAAPTTTAASTTSTTVATTGAPASSVAPAAVPLDEPPTIVDPSPSTAAPRPQATQPVASESTDAAPEATEPPVDGSDDIVVTDIGTPPVPPAADDTVITDIGTPPVPPATDGAPGDTVVTDIGTPPVPPATDDTVVTDIGTPPIPPTTDTVAG